MKALALACYVVQPKYGEQTNDQQRDYAYLVLSCRSLHNDMRPEYELLDKQAKIKEYLSSSHGSCTTSMS
jgi:hypothetical protein